MMRQAGLLSPPPLASRSARDERGWKTFPGGISHRCHSPTVPSLHMQLLGGFRLTSAEAPITSVETPRQQVLLAYLVLHCGVPQLRTKLASLFWPDSTEGQARTNLRNLLYKVRQALPHADRWLVMDRHALLWRAEGRWTLDVLDFERAVARADRAEQEGDRVALRLALEQAIALYYGELLPGCYEAWALRERERCSQVFLDVLERLLHLREEEGDVPEAIRLA